MTTAAVVSQSAARRFANPRLNALGESDRPVHDWYRFVLSYPPHLVRDYLDRFGIEAGATVLDPFCGTGTTVVECKKLGIGAVGIEANPLAHFASSVKTNWTANGKTLRRNASALAERIGDALLREGYPDDDCHPLFAKARRGNGKRAALRDLPEAARALLLENSISPIPLHKVLSLLEGIAAEPRVSQPYERLALAKALIGPIGNLHFGPEVGVGPPKPDAPVISLWLEQVEKIAADLEAIAGLHAGNSVVHHADARSLGVLIPPRSLDAVITSPPYPNEKDYTRTTRLESVLLGFIHDKAGLKAMKQQLLRSNTRNVFKGDGDDVWVKDNARVQAIAEAIEARRIELGKTSGFEKNYARVTRHYFGGMARHFAELKPLLKPGAKLAYVVGDQASYLRVMIRTGQLLAEIAEAQGYRVLGIDLFRTRLATATRDQLREEVVLLEWPDGN